MGTTAEKLTYLNETKGLLKDSINSLGGEITPQTTFRNYATQLENIYQNLPKVSGTGSNISLSPTRKGRITSQINGDTFQQTYTGKNLFDKNSTPNFVDNGCTYEILNTGIRAKLTANSDGVKYVRYVVMNLDGLENQKITAYAKVKPSNSQNARFTIGTCNSTGGNRNVLVQSAFANTETPQAITGTVPSTLDSTNNYLYILLYGATAPGIASGTYIDFEDLMIVKGEYTPSTIGSYEPYVGGTASPNPDYPQEIKSVTGLQKVTISGGTGTIPQEYDINLGNIKLNKIGDYKDYITGTPYNWSIKRQIGSIVLNGTETWGTINAYNRDYFYVGISDILVSNDNYNPPLILSNYYKSYTSGDLVVNDISNYGICRRTNYSQILFRNTDTNSLADFKTWLSTHNTKVVYKLAEPTTEPITNAELINQLNAFYNAKSYNGTTNISVQGDLPMILDVSAIIGD